MSLSVACVDHPDASLGLGILLSFCSFSRNTCVRTDLLLRCLEDVRIGSNELARVVGGTVSNHNLGGVLVGHNNGRTSQSVAMIVRVVGNQLLFNHSGVWDISSLEGVTITVIIINRSDEAHQQ